MRTERMRTALVAVVLVSVVTGTVVPGVTVASEDGVEESTGITMVTPATANVTGTVLAPDGSPLVDTVVLAESDGDVVDSDFTLVDGSYRLADLPTGAVYDFGYVQYNASDSTNHMPRDGIPDVFAFDRRQIDGDTDLGTISLPVASSLNVTVVNESGAPVENAAVTVTHRNETNGAEQGHRNWTATDGQFYTYNKSGIEVAENVTVEVSPPADEKYVDRAYTRNLTVTDDRNLTITLEEQRMTGSFVNPDGSPMANANVTITDFRTSSWTFEQTRTNATGHFVEYIENGSYNLTVTPLDSNDGVVDAWGVRDVTVSGSTDAGEFQLPRGYNLTVNATDGSGRVVDAYIDVRRQTDPFWLYEYASGTPLDSWWEGDSRGWYNVSRREVTNDTYELTALDSWTKDSIGTKTVTVSGAARTETIIVDPYNGTDVSGAVGPSVVRDLPTDRGADYTLRGGLDGDVNVRLFVLNTSAGQTVSVREVLPAGYEYVPGSLVGDGANVSNVTSGGGELAFDVDGAASAVRYKIRTTDGGRDIVVFSGDYTVAGVENATLGDDVIDSEAPTLTLDATPTSRVSELHPLDISFTTDDSTPSELALTVENASTGDVVYRRGYSTGGGFGLHAATWDATNESGAPVPNGEYVVRLASTADGGPIAEANMTVSVDTADPTVAIESIGASASPTGEPGTTVYTNGTLGVDLIADGTPGNASSVDVFLRSRQSNFGERYATTDEGAGAWSITENLSAFPDDGRFDVAVEAVDPAGNRLPLTSTTATVVLDRDAPELRATVERVNTSTARVDVVASEELDVTPKVTVDGPMDAATVQLTANGTHRWSGTFNVTDDGQYDLTATGQDLAGNTRTATASANVSTVSTQNRTVTVKMEPSGLFVQINTSADVQNSFVTMTGSRTPLAPLVRGNAGVNFLNAKLGDTLAGNLTNATIGMPVDEANLPAGIAPSDVSIRYYNETTGSWEQRPTTRRTVTLADGTEGEYWLAEVTHFSTYGAVAEDTVAPTLASATPTGDLSAGTTDATVRFAYGDALSGVNESEVTLTVDGTDVTDDAVSSVTGEYATYDATSLAVGDHTATVRVVDEAGNEATFDTTFTVLAPSSPDDGSDEDDEENTGGDGGAPTASGGGGGGGGSLPPPSILVDVAALADGGATVSYTGARSGEVVRTSLSGVAANGVSFTGLDLELAGEHGSFALDLVPVHHPDTEPLPSHASTITYLRIDHEVGDSVIGSAELDFTVKRSALPAGATLDDVAIYRFHDGSWSEIETSQRGNRFTAETPGFSVFAVVAESGEASFRTDHAALGRESVAVGETIDVSATVVNVGSERGTTEVALVVDGATVATRTLDLSAGESKTVVFDHTPEETGDHAVSIGGTSAGTLVVTGSETPSAVDETTVVTETTNESGQPGFGVLAALVALLVVGSRRRRR